MHRSSTINRKAKILGPEFFERPALVVAKDLIGKFLVRRVGDEISAHMIVETEAYFGFKDQGSHAHRGKTPRNWPMFERGGMIYVYFTYGMYWMLNLIADEKDYPAGILIRGLQEKEGEPPLNGPGKLARYLHIDKMLSGKMLGKEAGLWVEDRGVKIPRGAIKRTPRIGIPNRGEWTHKPWRFVLQER